MVVHTCYYTGYTQAQTGQNTNLKSQWNKSPHKGLLDPVRQVADKTALVKALSA